MAREMNKIYVYKITFSAVAIALGLVLPFFTGQIPQIGSMLLPMHLPVFICGMVCGGAWGGCVGFVLPLLRYALFGMPVIFPQGIAMACELAVYGIVAGLLYQKAATKGYTAIYRGLICGMVAGRLVWGVVFAWLCGMTAQAFTLQMFLLAAFVRAIPGIILQLVLVPMLVYRIRRFLE